METDDTEKPSNSNKLKGIGITNDNKNVRFETSDLSDEQVDATNVQNVVVDCMPHNVTAHQKPAKHNKKPKFKDGSGQKRVTIMFFLSHCDVCLVVHTPAHYLDSFIYV